MNHYEDNFVRGHRTYRIPDRRDNFELTNTLITSFSLNQVGARINALHDVKTITSYIRHNAIMHKPIEVFMLDGEILDDGMDDFVDFVWWAKTIKEGLDVIKPSPPKYTTQGIGGYE